jgi:hypothetical protein
VFEDIVEEYSMKLEEVRAKLEHKQYATKVDLPDIDTLVPKFDVATDEGIEIIDERREWAIHFTDDQISSIKANQSRYKQTLELSDSADLWTVYGTLADAYIEELFQTCINDFDQNLETFASGVFDREFV